MRTPMIAFLLCTLLSPWAGLAEEAEPVQSNHELPPVSFQVMLGAGPLWTDSSERVQVNRRGAVGLFSWDARFTSPFGVGIDVRVEVITGWKEFGNTPDPWGLTRQINFLVKPHLTVRVVERNWFRLTVYVAPPFFRWYTGSLNSFAFAPDGGQATSWYGNRGINFNDVQISATLGLDPDILIQEKLVLGCRLRAEIMSDNLFESYDPQKNSLYSFGAILVVGWRDSPRVQSMKIEH